MTPRHLYWTPQLPNVWIAREVGEYVMWPAKDNGWNARQPYKGGMEALRSAAPIMAFGTGWPGARP